MADVVFHGVDPERLLPWLGGAALLVAVLYLIRTVHRRTPITTGPIWERVVTRRRIDLKQILSYLLQLVVLASVLAALSDPGEPDARPHRRAVAIVVANGRAMTARGDDGTLRLGRVVETARTVLAAVPAGDPVAVFATAPTAGALGGWNTPRERLDAALEKLSPYATGADLDAAVADAAYGLARVRPAPTDARLLVIIGGAAATVGPPATGKSLSVHRLTVPGGGADLAVSALEARPAAGPDRGYEVWLRVRNLGDLETGGDLAVHSDEVVFGRLPVRLAPGESLERVYHLPAGREARPGVRLSARVVTSDGAPVDRFPDNDAGWVVLPEIRDVSVVLVTTGNRFLEAALRLNPEVALRVERPGASPPRMPPGGIAVFDRVTPRPLPDRAVLIDPSAARSPFRVARRVERPRLDDWSGDHPLLRGTTLHDLRVESASIFIPDAADVPLVSAEEGPIMVFRARPGAGELDGTAGVLAIGFDLARSDFPLKVAFPVFMRNVLRHFAGALSGDPVAPELPALLTSPIPLASDVTAVMGPGEEGARLRVTAPDGTPHFSARRAGFHRLVTADGSERGLPVWSATAAPVPTSAAPTPAAGGEIDEADPGELPASLRAALEPVEEKEAQRWFLWLALAAMAIATLDWFLYFLRVLD